MVTDIAEFAATPTIIQGCVKGTEKECNDEFRVFGENYTLSMNRLSKKPTETQPPAISHEAPESSTQSNACNLVAMGLEKRADCNDVTRYADATALFQRVKKVCQGEWWPQACFY